MRPGITKVEMVFVLALGLFTVGLIIMGLAHHRENASREECKNNLFVIGQAVHKYHEDSSGDDKHKRLPPSRIADGYATWLVLLAPYVTKENPLHGWDKEQSYFAQAEDVRQARLFPYFCPARRRSETLSVAGDTYDGKHWPGGLGDYGSVAGDGSRDHDGTDPKADGALAPAIAIQRKGERIVNWQSQTGLASLVRGQQYTLLAGERHVPSKGFGDAASGDGSIYNGQNRASFARVAGPGFPIAPAMDAPFQNNFGSYHHNICHFLMADTSVRPMSIQTSEDVLGRLARREE